MIRMSVPPSRGDSVGAPSRIGWAQGHSAPWRQPKLQRYAQAFLRKLSTMSLSVAVALLIFIDELVNFIPEYYALQSFIMGLLITAAIVLIFFSYSRNTDRAVESHLRNHRRMPGRGKRLRQARRTRVACALHASIDRLVYECRLLKKMGDTYEKIPGPNQPQFRDDFGAQHCNATKSADGVKQMLGDVDYSGDPACDDILAAIRLLKDAPPVDDGGETIDTAQYKAISRSLRSVQKRLKRRLDLADKWSAVAPGGLTLCLDRYTYPPGAAIRITVKASGGFSDGKVVVTILNEGLNEVFKKTEKLDAQSPGRPAPSTVAVSMNTGSGRLVAGQEYIARAEYGDLYGEAAFAIENIAPTVRANRPTCAVGGYMDITVKDPAAAAGASGMVPSCPARGQSLIVKSPCNEIDVATRLSEEDCPAGTFRVRVGCASARGCDGAENAAVACRPHQLIRIMYESAAGEACTAVLVEGPGPASASSESGGPDRPATGESGGDGKEPPPRGGEDRNGGTKGGSEGRRGR